MSWDVPALESLAGSKAYILRKRLNDGGTLTREEKDWITREVNHNTYFKDSIPLLGYRFNFVDVLKTITCYKITISLKYSFILSHFLCFLKPIRQSGHINQISFMCKPVNHCRHKHLVLYDFIPSVKSQISSNDCSLFSGS